MTLAQFAIARVARQNMTGEQAAAMQAALRSRVLISNPTPFHAAFLRAARLSDAKAVALLTGTITAEAQKREAAKERRFQRRYPHFNYQRVLKSLY